ncbi:MAG: LysR family transcriptional regulator [Kofleriaceae bacterium]
MDQLLAIRAFSRVVETGNFTRAADSLRMPKATVSKLVQTLETHLGIQLLTRTTRRVAVTTEGKQYYDQSTRLVKELEDIDGSFATAKAKPRGHLRVEVGSSVASRILMPALPSFLAAFPDVRIDFGVGDRPADVIADHVDCVIRGGPVTDTSLISRSIGTAQLETCATPAYLKQHGTPKHPRDLEQHRLVHYVSARSGRILPMRFIVKRRTIEIDRAQVIGVNESNAHFAAGLAGAGIFQTFTFLTDPAIATGALTPLLERFRPPPYPFHVAYAPNRHVSSRLRVFIDWVVTVFAKR